MLGRFKMSNFLHEWKPASTDSYHKCLCISKVTLAMCYSYGRYVMMHAWTGFGWVMTCHFYNIHTPTHDWIHNLTQPVNISNCPLIALGGSVNKGQVGDADVKWLEVIYRLHSVLKWHFDGTQPCHGPRMGSVGRHTHTHTYPDIPKHRFLGPISSSETSRLPIPVVRCQ